ncbi:MAG: hypothetical protein QF381_04675, partial [Nitrososphaerales archaeon]|nr:hypothetical protein [Nitrososphaerales archaeon]
GIPQTRWPSGKYKTSVEQIAAKPYLTKTKGTGTKFHGAGREDIYKDSAIFERFVRSAKTNDLPPLDEKKGQIGDAVLMPLVEKLGCMYHEAEQFFESDSLAILEQKTGGNPLHIRLLCSAMFNEFKQDENAEEIKINRAVLEKAMQKYQGWSSNSRQIQTALSTCTSDQLKAFSSLYFYEGLDVRSIIIEKMAFNNITPELEEKCLSNIRSDFDELQGLQLFNITDIDGKPVSISTIDDLTPTKAHNVKFDFIGDEFDRLYASYYYQSITNTDLDLRFSYELVDLLAQKLCNNVALMVVNNEEIEGYDSESPTLNYLNRKTPSSFEEVKDELDEISKKEEQTPEDISNVQTLSKDYNLVFPSRYAQAFNLQGYYVLEIDLIIFGKERNVRCFFPISSEEDKQTIPTRSLERSKYFSASLDEYNIEIRNLKLHWIPNQITILIFCAKTTDYETMLFNFTRDGKFDKATKQAKDLMDYSRTWGRKGKSYVSSKSVNNYAFTLINVGDILEAGKLLEQTHNKELTSSINLAYVELMNGKYHNARSRLKKIFNKVKELPQLPQGLAFIHLAIMHEGIDHANKMIRDTIEQNICAWNLMLIAADRNERGALDEFKTWPKLKDENEKLIHRRVLYWVENSLGNREKALSAARELFEDLNKESYLHKDVEIDIKVLSELAEDLQDSSEIRVGDKKGDADSAD